MQNEIARIAIIDDDPFVLKHLTHTFSQRLPDVGTVGLSDPIAPVGYDVYIIDREFGERSCGLDLIKRVKKLAPNSLVIAYSAFLDRDYLRSLVMEHCEGAFDKGSLEELEKMVALIESHIETLQPGNAASVSSRNTVRSIIELVREWNTRISQNGHASARYHSDV